MKLIANNETILTAESKEHAILQLLLFFECNSWTIDFTNRSFTIEETTGVIDE